MVQARMFRASQPPSMTRLGPSFVIKGAAGITKRVESGMNEMRNPTHDGGI